MRIVMEQRQNAVRFALLIAILAAVSVVGFGSSDDRANAQTDNKKSRTIGAWSASPVETGDTTAPPMTFDDQTIRNIVNTHSSGRKARITLSNEFGDGPVTFDSVFIGHEDEKGEPNNDEADAMDDASIRSGSNKQLTFGGQESVTIPAGETRKSDFANLEVKAFEDLAISFYLPETTGPNVTQHPNAQQTNFIAPGDMSSDESGAAFAPQPAAENPLIEEGDAGGTWYFLTDVDVQTKTKKKPASVVALGDSITDGLLSSVDVNNRYPDYLQERLKKSKRFKHLTVENQGIAGNRLLRDNIGPAVLNRLESDVFSQPKVTDIILFVGINDIVNAPFIGQPGEEATSEDIIAGYKQVIRKAHAEGICIYGGTLTPGGDLTDPANPPFTTYSSPQVNEERVEVNKFIRKSGKFDGFFDFDKAIRDPNNPDTVKDEFANVDNFHPNDAGYKRLAQEVDRSLLEKSGSCR